MSGLRKTLAKIRTLQRRFEGLLDAAQHKPSPTGKKSRAKLLEVMAFGSNPGELRMFAYVPERLASDTALVVALHGCSQSAQAYDDGAGWSTLADRLGFVVVYPEQQRSNNPENCFSWFVPTDITRDQGEVLSIRQMVEHAAANFAVDPGRVFVTGLSAGGAMASAMLATYPEVFAGGAIIGGLPYACAGSVQEAFEAMFTDRAVPASALCERVRAASSHRGPWPKISVWHGTADAIVKPSNAENIIRQWCGVHGLPERPSLEAHIGGYPRRVWHDAQGNAQIEAFLITGMAHGVPLAPRGHEACGAVGPFFLDAGISSTHHIARFWGLETADMTETTATTVLAPSDAVGNAVLEPVVANRDRATATGPLDPNAMIAAAFQAAGLPIPETQRATVGSTPKLAPGPIIEAALKAAGLARK